MNIRLLYSLILICCTVQLRAQTVIAQRMGEEDGPDVETLSTIKPGEIAELKIKQNLLLRVEVSKTSCFVGEPLKVVYKLCSRLNTSSQVMKRPSFTGFSVMEMVDNYDSKPEIEKINGAPYYVNLIRKVQLFPLQEGDFVLDPAEVESIVHFLRVNIGAPPSVFDQKTTLRSEPVTVHVKPLPAKGQPVHYTGAVGNYKVSLKGPDTAIHQGELVKVKVVVEGTGNISLLTPPEVKWPEGVDTADPAVKELVDKYNFPLAGAKVFEYSFAAPDTGFITIPKAILSYFDPQKQLYKEAESQPLVLQVKAGESEETRNLRSAAMQRVGNGSIPIHYFWFGGVVLIILGWLVFQFTRGGKKKQEPIAVKEPVKPVVEIPSSEDQLTKAREAMRTGNMKLFYHEIQQSLWNMAALRCEMPPTQLNKQNVSARLTEQGVQPALVQQLLSLLNTCEWALYVPDHEQSDPRMLLDDTRTVLDGLRPLQ
ncbi:protein BatD [Pseudoflavitalea sp. G-6-1-2]|uniref:BatD family protein n=1 Tax=Pseudoflavitalea sp. G-6-1-2 TaxID=2728841 RepID=UPI00146E1505|nr:BatD family protein [Pseudoflavitalea sp. G-6-1-2]NML19716.1 protein BatD [Pseudoflavitalea sp. G-6-1-2]